MGRFDASDEVKTKFVLHFFAKFDEKETCPMCKVIKSSINSSRKEWKKRFKFDMPTLNELFVHNKKECFVRMACHILQQKKPEADFDKILEQATSGFDKMLEFIKERNEWDQKFSK